MLEGDSIASNKQPPPEITMNLGLFLMIIFLIIGMAIFIAFICYHAKDKKLDNLKKLIQNPLSEQEIKLITDYRKLNDQNKQVITDAVQNLNDMKTGTDNSGKTQGRS